MPDESDSTVPAPPEAPGPKKLLRVIYKFLLISLVAHIIGLAIFGGVIVLKKLRPEEVTFEAPPPMVRVEPKKRQYKLRVKQQKKRSSRPVLQQRIQSTRMSSVALPDLKTRVAPVKQKTARIPGMSEGFGDGLSFGGGTGMGNIFGVQIQANHLGVLLDVSFSTHRTIHLAVKEIQKSFPNAVIVLVPGCGMQASQNNGKILTAQDLERRQKSLRTPSAPVDEMKFLFGDPKHKNRKGLMSANPDFKRLYNQTKASGNLFALHIPAKGKMPLILGTQTAFEFLIKDGVDAIYWFADFMDGIDKGIADRIVADLKKNNIAVYQQVLENPKRSVEKDRLRFAAETGGKVIRAK